MIIDLNDLREKGESLSVEKKWDAQELGLHNTVSLLRRPVLSDAEIRLSGERVSVAGRLEADLELICCRCLEHFVKFFQKSFELEYWPDPEMSTENDELALSYQDLVIGFYRNDELDLSAVVCEQILLEIPMKLVCRKTCKGLCNECGTNLNRGDCKCERSRLDPRLAVLRELKKRLGNEQ